MSQFFLIQLSGMIKRDVPGCQLEPEIAEAGRRRHGQSPKALETRRTSLTGQGVAGEAMRQQFMGHIIPL